MNCLKVPAGWTCPLGQGHDGDCVAKPIGAVPIEHLESMIRLLWPEEITPVAKRQLEVLIDSYRP